MQTTDRGRTDRQGLGLLDRATCERLLDATPVGRVAFTVDGAPVVLPVNHVRHGLTIGFRCAPGSKLDAAREVGPVAFEVDAFDPATRSGWSVLVLGTARVADPIEEAHFEDCGLRPWADTVEREHWVSIHVHRLSGRWVGHAPTTAAHAPSPQPDRSQP